jgi:hypothetical protein
MSLSKKLNLMVEIILQIYYNNRTNYVDFQFEIELIEFL